VDLKSLHAKIEELALENNLLEGALIKAGMPSAKPDDSRPRNAPTISGTQAMRNFKRKMLQASWRGFFGPTATIVSSRFAA
jgi:hypothetical protein